MPPCILVMGTPRSGTSCVAGVLHHLGVWMGDNFFPPDDWNERGFFADNDLNEMHWEIIREHDDDASHVDPVKEVPERYRAEIMRRANCGKTWGFKLSDTHAFLPHILSMVDDVRIIRTQRRFDRSVRSWSKINGETLRESIRVIGEYLYALETAISECGLSPLVVPYERLIECPREWVRRIADFAGMDVTDAAVESIEPALVRH